ncbi:MAG: DHA2 family efflux MFS transporter permease subunit [Rhizomicrobium sp.]
MTTNSGSSVAAHEDDPAVVIRGPMLVVAIGVLALANFMAVLDMTIVNVAVPHIAGSLAASPSEGTWSITSYSVAEAIMVPLTGWLAQRFGAVRVFVLSALGFGLFSALCGLSTSLGMLVVFRVSQGLCGGPLMPMSQTLLLRISPKRHVNMALGLWTMTSVLGPTVGPILGGTITDGAGWPWAFYINVPIAIVCGVFAWRLLASRDTPITKVPVDYIGFILLVVWIGALQFVLDNGHDMDWFGSPFIVTLVVVAIVGFLAFLIWEFTDAHPVVDMRVYRNRGFGLASVAMAFTFGSFFSTIVLVPLWLQSNMGYTATWAGYMVAFNGLFAVVMAPIAALLMSRVDPRLLMSYGLTIVAGMTLYRAGFATNMTFDQLLPPQIALGLGMPFFFVPLFSVSLQMVPPSQTATAAGLVNFIRSMSAAFATAIVTSLWTDEASRDRAQIVGQINHPADILAKLGGNAGHMGAARQMLDNIVDNQSVMVATNHMFLYIGLIVACVAMGVWLLPKPLNPARVPVSH